MEGLKGGVRLPPHLWGSTGLPVSPNVSNGFLEASIRLMIILRIEFANRSGIFNIELLEFIIFFVVIICPFNIIRFFALINAGW